MQKALHCPNVLGPGMQKRCTVPIFELETLQRLLFFLSIWDSTVFLLHCAKKIGTVQHFRPSRCRTRCTVPMFLGPGMQKRCSVPKNSKKLIFSGSPGQRLGQYGVFASLSQKDWDSTALQARQVQKTLYCPNVFGSSHAKTLYCPNL